MSFWPLPTSLAETLRASARRGPVLEFGAGEGAFAERLASLGLRPILLDLRRLPAGPRPRIRGDVLRPPIRRDALGLAILADSLRTIPAGRWEELADALSAVVGPGGRLAILEDEPEARDGAEACYRDVLRLLARVDARRGSCLDRDAVERALRPAWGGPRLRLHGENEEPVRDPLHPLRHLRATGSADPTELDRLERRVRRDGMRYGRYWALVFERPEA